MAGPRSDFHSWLSCSQGGVTELKQHPWFRGLDWELLAQRKLEAPYVPRVGRPLPVYRRTLFCLAWGMRAGFGAARGRVPCPTRSLASMWERDGRCQQQPYRAKA
jgi:hypothetical protein